MAKTNHLGEFLLLKSILTMGYWPTLADVSRKGIDWQFSSVQSFSHVRLFATPWIAARQASLFITNSRSSLKPFNITVIQVYAPTSNAEEAEVEQFYEDLQTF